jgi:uncharacterized protein YbjT (DUF2867 family)
MKDKSIPAPMNQKTAALLGATGLIGGHLLDLLLQDGDYQTIRVLSRRPLDIHDPKIELVVLDFSDEAAFKAAIEGCDAVFCSVGTTQNKVKGDMAAYRMVDYDIPVNAARFCAETGCPRFLLVSSVGADSKSRNFYIKLKGEVEDQVGSMAISSISIFRPSMLLGQRGEFRLGEKIAQVLMRALAFLIPSDYKPIHSRDVARAMIAAAKRGEAGVQIYYFDRMTNSSDE